MQHPHEAESDASFESKSEDSQQGQSTHTGGGGGSASTSTSSTSRNVPKTYLDSDDLENVDLYECVLAPCHTHAMTRCDFKTFFRGFQ